MNLVALSDSITAAEQAQTEAWCDVLEARVRMSAIDRSFGTHAYMLTDEGVLALATAFTSEYQTLLDALTRWMQARAFALEMAREMELQTGYSA